MRPDMTARAQRLRPADAAAVQNRADAIKVLVEAGADVHAVAGDLKKKYERISIPPTTVLPTPYNDTNTMFRQSTPTRFTPLLFAARAGSIDAARALIAAGANVNDTLTDGTSALVLAIINAHYELAGVLLDKGANVNAQDKNGQTPVLVAVIRSLAGAWSADSRAAAVLALATATSDTDLVEAARPTIR